jgi:hypothetical protein
MAGRMSRISLVFLLVMAVMAARPVSASAAPGAPPAAPREEDIVSAASLSLPQKAKLTGSQPASDQGFGASVALDGDTALIGDPYARAGTNSFQGAAYVFVRNSATWVQQARLTANDGSPFDGFGRSVALDGDTAIVGAHYAPGPASSDQGAAYVFRRTGTTWTFEAKLTAFDGATADLFGASVAVQGNTAVVGAPEANVGTGGAYVFTRIADTWIRGPKLSALDGTTRSFLGISVALGGDTAIVGAQSAPAVPSGDQTGAAYVYTRTGSAWTQQAKLIPNDGVSDGQFGASLAFEPNTSTVLIGAPCARVSCRGGAYIFRWNGTSWIQRAKLTASDTSGLDQFGWSVAITGQLAVVGASANIGAAYVFAGTGGVWTEQTILRTSEGHVNDFFGRSVAISGETVIVGAFGIAPSGAAYVFANTPPTLPVFGSFTTPEDVPLLISFAVSDPESAPDTVALSASSSNPTLVTGAGLAVGGTGADRTLTITPTLNQSGETTIRLLANDGFAYAATDFRVTVTPVNDAPTISVIADQTIVQGHATAAMPFTIGDVDTSAAQLLVSATSSNSTLVPTSGIVLGGANAARLLTLTPAPHEHGTATITIVVSDGDALTSRQFTLTVQPPPTYYLAEGATGAFFDMDLLIANPNDAPAPIGITFFKEDGTTVVQDRTLAPLSRTTIQVDDIAGLEATSLSTAVTSTNDLPLAVERTMRWDASGYGAHGEKATDGAASQWFFAEGSQGFFSTYFLLVNPSSTANAAHVTYFREGEPTLVRDYPLLPASRFTIDAGAEPDLVNRSFGAQVVFDQPGVAERAMYFGRDPFWSGGHDSAGVTAPSATWFLAEGATGSFFNTFVLLVNPNADETTATLTYFTPGGPPITRAHTIGGGRRLTINLADEDPSLASAAISTRVESTRPILVERSQYWPQPAWYEGHNSFGVTATGAHWGLAEGRVGGPSGYQTYILLANPGTDAADVTVRFLRTSGPPVVKTFSVAPSRRFNVAVTGPDSDAPELVDEAFGAVIESTQPIAVERAMYNNANGVVWAAGTNATATRLP